MPNETLKVGSFVGSKSKNIYTDVASQITCWTNLFETIYNFEGFSNIEQQQKNRNMNLEI